MAIPVGTAVGYLTLDYSQFSSNLTTAINEASSFSGKLSDTLGSGFKTIGNSISTVGATLTTGITIPLGTAGASAIKFGAEFDKQMSAVKAVTNATTDGFNRMRDAAIQWGGKTVYTATEASQALYYMGLAGWDTEKSISALGPVLNLAAAGNLELDRTSDIVTDAMTAMKLEAGQLTNGVENTTHFVNVMAQTMSSSNTDVDQLGEAFKYVTPLAGSLGYSIDDLGLALGLMANVGVKASQAGTSLRQALKSVIAPTSDAQSAMDKYGISLYDSEGKAKSLRQFMQELRGTFKDLGIDIHDANGEVMDGEQIMEQYGKSLPLTQQEKLNDIVTIFGTRALPGVLGIIEQSDEKFNDLAASIDGADNAFDGLGAAAGIAEIQMDNLQGDWIRFTSALGTAKIAISDIANGALRQFVQSLTELVTKFNNLDTAQQEHILKIAALIAAIGPLLFIFGKLISGIGTVITTFNSLKKAFDLINVGFTMLGTGAANVVQGFKLAQAGFTALGAEASPLGASLSGIVTALQPMAGVILGVVAVIGVLIAAFVHLWKNNEEFRNNVIGIWNDLKLKFAEAGQAIVDLLNELGFCFEDFKDVVDAVVSGIKVVWNGLCEFLGPVIIAVIKTVTSAISGLVTVFTGVIQIITGLIRGFKDGDWSTLWEGLKNVVSGFINFMSGGLSAILEAIYNMVKKVANWFGVDWKTTFDEAKQKVSDFVKNIVDWFIQLPSHILNELKKIVENIANFGIEIVNYASQIGSNFVNNIISFFQDLPGKIGFIIGYVITSIISFGATMASNAIDIGSKFVNNVISFIKELPNKVLSFLTSTINNIKTFKSDMAQYAKDIGNQFIQNVVSYIRDLPNKIKEQFNNTINKARDFVNDFKNKARDAANGFKNALVDGARDIPNKMADIGRNIVSGVWRGIQNARAAFEANVKSFFQGIVNGAKAALGISSPSKVMAKEIGVWLPPGISEGFEKAMPNAIGDMQKSIDNGISELDTDDGDLSISVSGFANDFVNVVDKVTIWFESIEERLANIVDSMRHDISDMINLGNVLMTPNSLMYDYKTGSFIGENNVNVKQDDDVINLLKYIVSLLEDNDDNPVDGGDIIIPVYIGSEEIDSVVVTANDRNNYRSGGR